MKYYGIENHIFDKSFVGIPTETKLFCHDFRENFFGIMVYNQKGYYDHYLK